MQSSSENQSKVGSRKLLENIETIFSTAEKIEKDMNFMLENKNRILLEVENLQAADKNDANEEARRKYKIEPEVVEAIFNTIKESLTFAKLDKSFVENEFTGFEKIRLTFLLFLQNLRMSLRKMRALQDFMTENTNNAENFWEELLENSSDDSASNSFEMAHEMSSSTTHK